MRTRTHWAVLTVALFAIEVSIATVFRHVPFVRADLGDFLVVILLFAFGKTLRPAQRALPLALGVFTLGVVDEAAQAWGLADRLGLPRGSIARIVIGTTFQWIDLAMYAAGSATAWLLDVEGRRKR